MSEMKQLRARVASLTEQVLAKNARFGSLMKRAFTAGTKDESGRVRVVFVVELEEKSTNTDAEWQTSSSKEYAEGRNGEQALASLVEKLEARNG